MLPSSCELPRGAARAATPVPALRGSALGMDRERTTRCGSVTFTLQCTLGRMAAPRRGSARLSPALSYFVIALRRAARTRLDLPLLWRPQRNTGAARLGQAYCDRLPGRARAVLALTDVLDFLAYEFAGRGGGTLPLPEVAPGPLRGAFRWHVGSSAGGRTAIQHRSKKDARCSELSRPGAVAPAARNALPSSRAAAGEYAMPDLRIQTPRSAPCRSRAQPQSQP